MFDEILADCLESLAKGATIRECLTRYPAEAAALEPLLRLAVALGREGETRLSPGAFRQGRRQLRSLAQARQAQSKQESVTHQTPIYHRQLRHTPPAMPQQRTPLYQQNGRPLSAHHVSAKPVLWPVRLPRLLRVALVLLAIVGATTFFRQVTTSLPGTWLYPVKSSSARMVEILITAAGDAGSATPTPVEEVTAVAVTATTTTPILTPTSAPTVTSTPAATATPTITPTPLLQPSATVRGAPILEPSPTATPTLALATVVPVVPSPTAPPTPLPEITVQMPRQESSEQDGDEQDGEASSAEAPTATVTPLAPEVTQTSVTSVETATPAIGTGPEEGTAVPTVLSTEVAVTPTTADQPPPVSSGEGVWPATATPESTATNATRPTNPPSATKTPKATVTQANPESATPNAPTPASVPTTAPTTPVERTPNATTQAPIVTKESATNTPVVATPTARTTTASGEATKTPQP